MQTAGINVVSKKHGERPRQALATARALESETPDSTRIVRETARGLVAPRRLIPIVLVCAPMLVAQGHLSRPSAALALGVALCLAFVFVAPVSWRLLLPDGALGPDAWVRLLLYAAIGAGAVLSIGLAVPRLFGISVTFMTARTSLAICLALFLVGGGGRLPSHFMRVHRRALLNLEQVVRLEPMETGGLLARTARGDGALVSRQAARELRRMLGLRKVPGEDEPAGKLRLRR